ncbi:hypothetical protein [Paenibacillus alvei]|uniref:hypothetical protein n=1 Tax=Paenibacillus alvei TaxID=44250 RepID=UPI0013DA02FD|nr:hypothetical protein [Paenibacillus alvei]NEZ44391.1 hypothetical protein [Paenibacillus alvei]
MEQITGWIKWTVSVLLVVAAISAGMMLWNKAVIIQNVADDSARRQSKAIVETQYSAFDNTFVSGSQILTALRRYENKDIFSLYVQIQKPGVSVQNFGMQPKGSNLAPCRSFDFNTGKLSNGQSACNISEEQVTDVNDIHYIPPQGRFKSSIVRDENDRITGLFFKSQ